jgi:uncharacterized metal-binding protein
MPCGKTHDKISTITAPIVGIGAYLITSDIKITMVLMFTYVFASFMFNGDLDTNSRPYNRWWLFKMIWIPYQLMFEHRSTWTHGLIIGTIIRLLYLGVVPFIFILLKGNLEIIKSFNFNIIVLMFIGLELGSANHTISDKIF